MKGPFARRYSSRRRRRPAGGVRSAGPAMPWRGGVRGLSLTVAGLTRAMSAPGHRPQPPFPFAVCPGGPSGPLGVRGPGGQGAVRGGLPAGTRARQQRGSLSRKESLHTSPPPAPACSSPALLPGTAQPLGAGELLRLFEMCPHIRGAAVCNRGRRERFPLLPGMKCCLFLPRSIPPSRRSRRRIWGPVWLGLSFYFSVGLTSMKELNSPKRKV